MLLTEQTFGSPSERHIEMEPNTSDNYHHHHFASQYLGAEGLQEILEADLRRSHSFFVEPEPEPEPEPEISGVLPQFPLVSRAQLGSACIR